MSQPQPIWADRRLDSWKEIAAFFGRDVRTVCRWEKSAGLPVRRMPGSTKARVFAYESELAAWMSTARAHEETEPEIEQLLEESPAPPDQKSDPGQTAVEDIPARSPGKRLRWVIAAFAAVLCCALVAVHFYREGQNRPTQTSAGPVNRSTESPAATAQAQELYLKGRYYWNKRTPEDLNRAVDYFTQAVVHDPNLAQGYIGLADSYNLLREFSAMSPDDAFPRALSAAQKAVELDPNSADAHTSLAFVEFWGYLRVADADEHFRKAAQLDPKNTRAHHWYATYLAEVSRFPEALDEIDRARRLDPASAPILADKGLILEVMHRDFEAEELLKQIEGSDAELVSVHQYLASLYFAEGRDQLYLNEAEEAARLRHDEASKKMLDGEAEAFRQGGSTGLLSAQLRMQRELYDRGSGSDYELGRIYSMLNQKSEALQHLQRAAQQHDRRVATLLVDRALDNVRQEPAFRQLPVQAGLLPPSEP